jgi:hypothetical protein
VGFKIAAGVLSVMASVLASLQTTIGGKQRVDAHRSAASAYDRITQLIKRKQVDPPGTVPEQDELMDDINQRLDRVAAAAPTLAQKAVEHGAREVAEDFNSRGDIWTIDPNAKPAAPPRRRGLLARVLGLRGSPAGEDAAGR